MMMHRVATVNAFSKEMTFDFATHSCGCASTASRVRSSGLGRGFVAIWRSRCAPTRETGNERHDVVIVGAGTAGVSCALECFDIQLDTAVFEADERPGGQLVEIPHSVRNVAIGSSRDGPALRDSLEQSAAILGDRLRRSHPVTRVDLGERWIEVDAARVQARALVIATGTFHQQLPAAEDGAFGGDVTYLLEARPGRFDGRDVVVIGGGDSGTLDALELAREGSKVWLVYRSEALSARR